MNISNPRALMIQGTGSDVGKSMIVAGLCRALTRRGFTVRPFKPQNMSNNAAVTAEGGEIGRAQALQARACGAALSVHMNPVLLKPESDGTSQIILQGKAIGRAGFRDYQARREILQKTVFESFNLLKQEADFILVEGAGSPAEINLRSRDIANMGFAVAHNVPVVLAADIDRGGVIAALVGTQAVLSPEDRAMLKGFIINKFRGDVSLFDDGVKYLVETTGLPHFGTLPYLSEAGALPQEDGFSLEQKSREVKTGAIKIAVPMVSRISNFDDFDPLRAEPDVSLTFIRPGEALPGDCHVIMLPGTKSALGDLAFIRAQGWDVDILAHMRRGGFVFGICGGYQILGRELRDPHGYDGKPGSAKGLGLLDIETDFTAEKRLEPATATCRLSNAAVSGYRMHCGRTTGPDTARPLFTAEDGSGEGAQSLNGKIFGAYYHGIFASDAYRAAFLRRLRPERQASDLNFEADIDRNLDALADRFERYLDMDALISVAENR